jgi:uncharacterized protein (DUF305 family)
MKHAALASVFSLIVLAAEGPAKAPASAAFERRFLEMMARHHQAGIEMFLTCGQKAARAELKEFCGKTASQQAVERRQMMDWRMSWYRDEGGIPKDELAEMIAGHNEAMTQLETAGAEFDREFIELMTKHHRQGLSESQACAEKARHAELKKLCARMAADRQREIGRMQAWSK